ncbi:triphosphate tunel metalloenzyme 3 [Phalaenopsis equestris]|uniref:triphosphate tunel metalloenzyme 3 n=1 Tax=Phalaenopsis equestris TaxID=78828 RepID=UPI0009E1F504|nr:triphosphate tunel metalloenzyme 3 [Phalaenopsis equestris]XP_020579359.1 triphosphate tunel metalloenzyme 3 [Phalaenopsis equestris]XP_020579360.1 triphosphate tunel metalloenzyme 3 [Phalaenopsis equestris]
MEVEVKFRLPNAAAHQRLSDALAPFHLRTHMQENLFFDGSAGELSNHFAVARIRFYDGDSRCVLSLKLRARLVDGISRVEEIEEDIDPALGRACVAEPWRLGCLSASSKIMGRVRDEFGIGGEGEEKRGSSFICLGGFRNVRGVYGWKEGLTLELDETRYDFGASYELECETGEPEKAKEMLEGFLLEKGVEYSYSKASKFAVFKAGKLLP